jgi:transcriptional regulator of acetoin/glycerol metabolism
MQEQTSSAATAGIVTSIDIFDARGRPRRLLDIENEMILATLRHNRGSVTKTAAQLGIGRSTLYRRLADVP